MKNFRPYLMLLLSGLSLLTSAQQVQYSTWGPSGFTLEQQDPTGVQLSFSVPQLTLGTIDIQGNVLQTVEIPGVFLPNNEGAPNLPGTGRFIAIPKGATASLEIIEMHTEVLHNIDLAQAPRIPKETEDGLEYPRDLSIYSKDAFYPAQPVLMSEPTSIRGVDAVMVGLTPFQYNPVTKDLIVYTDIRIRVSFTGGTGYVGDDRLRSRWFDPLLDDMLLNANSLPKVDFNISNANTDDVGFEYLIIVPNDAFFTQWADTIKRFRTRQGISTGIKTLAEVGGNTTAAIESYLNNAYNTWTIPPVACLLIGDYGTNAANTLISPIWNSYCVSDNIYGDVTGNSMPDIIMARMTAQNAAQLEVMVRKFIDYERTPPTNPNFYAHPISALGWQTERWFQVCSEVIGGFWNNNLGKETVRINAIYQGNPLVDPWSTATNTATVINYFGPSGLGYIPATPQSLSGWSGGTPAMVNQALNAGSFMLQHRDHGFESGWGEPDYTNSDINGLYNTDLSFIMSVNCLTGKYNYASEVFAEKFHRYTWNGQPAGAVGILAASEVSYSFVNDAFIWGVYDNMWPEFMPAYGSTPAERGILPAFGAAAGKYFLKQSSWPYNTSNKEVTYNLFHHHGDAFLSVYSEVPQQLTVVHSPIIYPGVTGFEVTANSGSLICLSFNGVILGTGIGSGSPVSITIPGTQVPPDLIDVVVTLQNYYRYEGVVSVIPPTGPYIIKNSFTVNDAAGNGNGLPDNGESIQLTVGMKNVGVLVANNVMVSLQCVDPYITLTDATENYGNINPSTVNTIPNGFAFNVANNVPDAHVALFNLVATSGSDTWTSSITLLLNAPKLAVASIVLADPTGNNNNRLDPGETVTLTITTKNNGHADALSTLANLLCMDTSVTIVNASVPLGTLLPGGTQTAVFTLQVSTFATYGTNVNFLFTAASGSYQASKYFIQTIGVTGEDWECNSFTHYSWVNNSTNPWTITNSGPYEGLYCVRSGAIPNNSNTQLSITLDVLAEDSISFYSKVSSEATYDFLQFLIDGTLVDQWSGNVAWERNAYAVTPGSHTFTWKYLKDVSTVSGSDRGWIDYIVFPPFGAAALSAAATATPATVCLGSTTQLAATVLGGMPPYTYQWSPAALLSDPAIANPVATPTTATVFTVTVTDLNGLTQIAGIPVSVLQIPAVPATPSSSAAIICQGSGNTLVTTSSVPNTQTYSWSLMPSTAGTANGSGTSAWLNWNPSFSGTALVTVKSNNACGQSEASSPFTLQVLPQPVVSLASLPNVCVYWSAIPLAGGTPAGGVFSGLGVGSGMFDPSQTGAGTFTITYTYTNSDGCSNTATQSQFVDACSGINQPSTLQDALLYPNPSKGVFTIRLPNSLQEPIYMKVTNPMGNLVYNEERTAGTTGVFLLDLGHLSAGVYFLTLETGGQSVIRKIILEGK